MMKGVQPSEVPFSELDAIVFDLDGTLYDMPGMARHLVVRQLFRLSFLAKERLTRKALSGRHFASKEAFYEAFFSEMARKQWFSSGLARRWYFRSYLPAMVRVIGRYYHAEPWALEIIRLAQEKGIRVALYSDYELAEDKLQTLGIPSSHFQCILSAADLGGMKPCRESMEQVLHLLGVSASRTLMIGDKPHKDGASAEAVGAKYLCCK